MADHLEHNAADHGAPHSPHNRGAESPLRDVFHAFELAMAMSHYDIGVIESIREYPRGSPNSPKALIRSERGLFLIKRIAPGRDDLQRVAFAHAIQLHLIKEGFPAPRIIGTRDDNNSILRMRGRVYELYEFIHGSAFDHSPRGAEAAGRELAILHDLLSRQRPNWTPLAGGYHNIRQVGEQLETLASHLGRGPKMQNTATRLARSYREAAAKVESCGAPRWRSQIIHGDWHPGNMLFREGEIAAVFDFDTARTAPRVLDVANGALQFSLTRGGDSPGEWPDSLDTDRFLAFSRGYHDVERVRLGRDEAAAVPPLMIEALVVEAAAPVAATGSFDRYEGEAFLEMIARKVNWIEQNAASLSEAALGAA